jgi:3-dehydroquinate dehydratase-1
MNNYCLPIIATSVHEIESVIGINIYMYQYFEIWIDYIEHFQTSQLVNLAKLYPGRLIVVFRRKLLERPLLDTEIHKQILAKLSLYDCYIDLDIFDQQSELAQIKGTHMETSVICSYHNYENTPSMTELSNIIASMMQYEPQIYKISCHCQNEQSALRLLELLLDLKVQKLKYIVLGMGDYGSITRLYGPLWGNHLNFLALRPGMESANGQLSIDQFKKISKTIGTR